MNGVRLVASAGLAAAFGGCNWRMGVGRGPKSIKQRAAVLMQAITHPLQVFSFINNQETVSTCYMLTF